MSGKKETYVSVRERELRRLREQESRLRNIQNDLPDRLNQIRRQTEAEFQNRLRPLEERQKRYESAVNTLTSEMGKMEREMLEQDRQNRQRLQQQQKEFSTQMRQQRGEYLHLFEEQDRKMTQLAKEERLQREQSINHLQRQIDDVVANAARKQDIAQAFVADLTTLVEEVRNIPHDRFAPNQLEPILRNLRDATNNLSAGIPEAALATSQIAYWQVVDLRSLVRQKEAEFIMVYQAALEEARLILEEAKANRQYKLEVGTGVNTETLALEVDHWSHGALTALEQKIQSLEQQLISGEESLSTEAVKDIFLSLESARPEIQTIVDQARDNILSSQLRYNVAEMVVQALASQGFSIETGVYEGNDERNAYVAKVRNIAGTEVVTVISPVGDEAGKNRISIHSYDETFVAKETLCQRAEEISRLLGADGLDVSTPTCKGNADPLYRDVAAVATRKQAEVQDAHSTASYHQKEV